MRSKQAIFVFGMARSGTSALARVLAWCGASLPEQLLGPNEGNPTGHWEPIEALQLNEQFLYANGSTYYDPSLRLEEEEVISHTDKVTFIERIARFLDSCPQDRPLVLKEPRIVGLSDYWFEAARRSGFEIKVVIPVRHPEEVARSLAKRDQASIELSTALWLKYNLLAERRSRHLPRVFVEYSNVLADWQTQISRISEALSVRLENRDEEAIRRFLTTDLHRQRSTGVLTELFGRPWVGAVYGEFSAAAHGAHLDMGKLDKIFVSYRESERVFRTAAAEFRNGFSGDPWASDLTPFLALVVEECSREIARRFGDTVGVSGAPVDVIRTRFQQQADRVSAALATFAAQEVQLQHLRTHADAMGKQFLDASGKLMAAHTELTAQRLSWQNQKEESARDLARHKAQLADSIARASELQRALTTALRRLSAADDQIVKHQALASALQAQVDTYEHSHSWRVTAPLRAIRRRGRASSQVHGSSDAVTARFRSEPNAIELEALTPRITSLELPAGFDAAAYLALNPDVAAHGADPVHHYMNHGWLEGRPYSYPAIDLRGLHHFRPDRDSILVVSHEASRTGAPIVSLNIVLNLVEQYNVVALLLGDGPLDCSFLQAGAVTVISPVRHHPVLAEYLLGRLHDQFKFRFAFVNSIESRIVLKPLAARFVPVVSLIHEFAAYTRPRDAFPEALLWSSDVVFSTDITRQSVLQDASCSDARCVHTLPQGRCLLPAPQMADLELEQERQRLSRWMRPNGTGNDVVVVLGAGSVHLRKGVDLFIEVAARVVAAPDGINCRFIWLGNGYDPDGDVHYSAYLHDQIQRAGLERHVLFGSDTKTIETAYQEADLFLMSSRLDPLPNVAVDALSHGKPVLCFDRATGIADFLKTSGLGDHCVATYLDTAEMADKVTALARSKSLRHEVGERGREAAASYFNLRDYVTSLERLARDAVVRTAREREDVDAIVDSGLFRVDFSVPPELAPLALDAAVRLHVRSWASGIRRRKPFPGFHPGIYLELHGVETEGTDPTADYIRAGRPDGPWNSVLIESHGRDECDLPSNRSVALHLHVFYPDLVPEIMARLSRNKSRPDLLVSVTREEDQALVAGKLEEYDGRVAAIEVVPNRGRDIGPLLTAFGRRIVSDYEYVGHIHTKKTTAVKDAALGKTWFEFLMTNLLGDSSAAMADTILARMKADQSLGIVFPDDPHAQGWNNNRDFAEALARKIGLAELPEHFNFPVGTMFWARTSALAPLIRLNFQWDDYPAEPLKYDGTLLHAIERLLPLTLPVSLLHSATTNVAGTTR
jgi:glycosyltransferase involved in cell wall biosynthesis